MESVEQLAKAPGVLKIGERQFVILPPTPRDMLAVGTRMRELARSRCVSPLDYVLKHTHLNPAALSLALREAIALGAGPPIKLDPESVWEQYDTIEGLRFRVWYHVSRAHKDFTPEQAEELVTEDNLFDVADALNQALRFGELDPKKETPETPTGTSG